MGKAGRKKAGELDLIALGLAILSATPIGSVRTLEEIAAYCQCSHQRIRQIEINALKKLRNRLTRNEVKELLANYTELSRTAATARDRETPIY